MGIAGMPEIPIVSHFSDVTDVGGAVSPPTTQQHYSIPVKSKSLQFLHGNQSVQISKLQGLRVYMQSL